MSETPTTIQLPTPVPPIVVRVWSNRPDAPGPPILWAINETHPLMKEATIVRMILLPDRDGVDVYTVTKKGEPLRHHIPDAHVRLTEEIMPASMWVDEIEAAETDDDDDDPESGGDTDTQPPPAPNGQVS